MASGVSLFEQPGPKHGITGAGLAVLLSGREGFLRLAGAAHDTQGVAILPPGPCPQVCKPQVTESIGRGAGIGGDACQFGETEHLFGIPITSFMAAVDQSPYHGRLDERCGAHLLHLFLRRQEVETGERHARWLHGRRVRREESGDGPFRRSECAAVVISVNHRRRCSLFQDRIDEPGQAPGRPTGCAQTLPADRAVGKEMARHLRIACPGRRLGGTPQEHLQVFERRMVREHLPPPSDEKNIFNADYSVHGRGRPTGSIHDPLCVLSFLWI